MLLAEIPLVWTAGRPRAATLVDTVISAGEVLELLWRTRRGRNTLLTEPRRVQVLHDGQWLGGWVTATRREPGAW